MTPFQHCARCGTELYPLNGPLDYDPTALCPTCRRDKEREDEIAEARQEVLDWVDGWLARHVPWSLRESLWEAGRKRYDLKEDIT